MPVSVGGNILFVERPRIEGSEAQCVEQFLAVQTYITSSRWNWASINARATLQVIGIVTADSIDDLSDLIQAKRARAARMKEPWLVVG